MKMFFLFRDAVVRFLQRSSRRVGHHTSDKDNNGAFTKSIDLAFVEAR
jgi:hypothetical protein